MDAIPYILVAVGIVFLAISLWRDLQVRHLQKQLDDARKQTQVQYAALRKMRQQWCESADLWQRIAFRLIEQGETVEYRTWCKAATTLRQAMTDGMAAWRALRDTFQAKITETDPTSE